MEAWRRSAAVGALLAASVAGVSGAVTTSAAANVQPAAAPAGWTTLSSGNVPNIQSIGAARFGSDLQLAWVQDNGDATSTLDTRIVGSDGTPKSATIAVASSWSTINEFPAVLANGSQRVIAFSGIQNTDATNPYSEGYEYYETSTNGTTWTLSQGALSERSTAYSSDGTDAVDAGGTPIVAYTSGSDEDVTFHSGFLDAIPDTPGTDPTTAGASACCTYDSGLGYDASNGTTWAAWYSNSGDPASDGFNAQQIEPTLGNPIHPTKSTTTYIGGGNASAPPLQRIVVSSRVGGGVYGAYVIGYPSPSQVALWQLGPDNALTRSAGGDVERVGTAAGPGGRVWLYWWNASSKKIEIARTNPAATKLGATCAVSTPGAVDDVWDLVGNASGGPLQLFALAGSSHQEISGTVVLPCLTVAATPSSVSAKKGGSVKVMVSDAGAAIHGATVSFAGKKKTTDSHGVATFSVAKHHAKGSFAIVVTSSGYQQATSSVRVH